jgi:Lon-like protease
VPRRAAFSLAILGIVVLAALALSPSPYWSIAPGAAIDLSRRIAVEGYAPPKARYYLTDVTIGRASFLGLVLHFAPGTSLVRRDALVPPGESQRGYERLMSEAMTQSQRIAALVAERGAGLHVPAPAERTVVEEVPSDSRAAGVLRPGDVLVRVGSASGESAADVERAMRASRPGLPVPVVVEREGRALRLHVPTTVTAAGPRFGIQVRRLLDAPQLPVPVHFDLENVEGSSGGLMFALQIYATLRGAQSRGPRAIAGTGSLAADGSVRAVAGVEQKLLAAKRAGADVFFVPRQNFAEIAHERGLRVVPVDSFRDAVTALARRH